MLVYILANRGQHFFSLVQDALLLLLIWVDTSTPLRFAFFVILNIVFAILCVEKSTLERLYNNKIIAEPDLFTQIILAVSNKPSLEK